MLLRIPVAEKRRRRDQCRFFGKYRQFPATLIFRFRTKPKNYEADTKAIRRTLIFSRFFEWSMQ